MLTLPSLVLAVDPVPWARAQMAFTLATHIILVPLGVSWAFMVLVANYRAIKKNDADALLLAQRWSKYMAVTFAVGAVTGTVLTFEFGLLWPTFMGRFGDAFGIPFTIEGLFFFTEAIFLAIYIYGWKRLKPWPHFWTGVPDRDRGDRGHGVGDRGERVDERTIGIHAELGGQRRRRRPARRHLQQGVPARGGTHAGCGVPRRRVPDRIRVRVRNVAGKARPVSPARFHHPVHCRGDRHARADARR